MSSGHQVALSTWCSMVTGLVVSTAVLLQSALHCQGYICAVDFPCSSAIWLPLWVSWLEMRRWERKAVSVVVAAAEVDGSRFQDPRQGSTCWRGTLSEKSGGHCSSVRWRLSLVALAASSLWFAFPLPSDPLCQLPFHSPPNPCNQCLCLKYLELCLL